MRASAAVRDKSTYKHGVGDPQVLSEKRRAYFASISDEVKYQHLRNFIAAGQIHNKKSSKTRIETTIADLLNACSIGYQQNVQLGRYNVDFLVADRLIVECYGDYWHCNPRYVAPDTYNRSLHMTAQERWAKDARRQAALEARGYQFLAFWETDIYADIDTVKKDILHALNR